MNRGEIYLCDLGKPLGHERGFLRPALIVSASEWSKFGSPIVVPMTRTRRGYITHVELEGVLGQTSYIQCEQIRVVSQERLVKRLGEVDGVTMLQVEDVLHRLLGF